MEKKKRSGPKGSINNPVTSKELEDILNPDLADYRIIQATIGDDYLSYQFICNKGNDKDDTHKIPANKEKLIKDSLRTAFAKLNVHAACMDDVFKHNGIEIAPANDKGITIGGINDFHTHDLTGLYHVTGFAISGPLESESVVLTATKYVSMGGRISFPTPKTVMDNLASYKHCDELKAALEECRKEVDLFKNGNYIPVVEPEPEEKSQPTLFDTDVTISSAKVGAPDSSITDDDFDNAKQD